jgi:DNA-binding NtrC family response regulator
MHNQSAQQVEHSTISDNMSQEEDFRLEEMERKLILAALKRFDGNRRLAANVLGISERTLYRKIVDYQLIELF